MTEHDVTTFPMSRTCPLDPPPEYTRLRSEQPIHRARTSGGTDVWLVTRHEDVRAILCDPRFSSDRRRQGFPVLVSGQRSPVQSSPPMISMDGPEHAAARRTVLGEFTVKRMQALRPRIQEIVDDCVDDVLAGERPVDLVKTLSLPVPSLVICELLGVPYRDHDFFQQRTARMIQRSTPAEERNEAVREIRSYLADLITEKDAVPQDDLLGRLIRKQRAESNVDHAALVSMAFLLLVAGHETTANMISLGAVALLRDPDQLGAIREDPAKTLPAVEELLRYFTIADAVTARTATEDVEIGGVRVRAGEGVIALGAAANRDPEAFDRPDELDIDRNARQHVAFGFGPHQCLGQNLARMELQIVFDTLFRRVPGLRLAVPFEEIPFKDDATIYGIFELPVEW